MKAIHLLATGESMSVALAESLRGHDCLAVSDAFKIAPWAIGVAAQDHQWWVVNRVEVDAFQGRKFSANRIPGVTQVFTDFVQRQSSSGVLAIWVAWRILQAETIYLHGFNNKGTHYFGPHKEPLQNTLPSRFRVFESQYEALEQATRKNGVRVINVTPDSALKCFERGEFIGLNAHATQSAENA